MVDGSPPSMAREGPYKDSKLFATCFFAREIPAPNGSAGAEKPAR